MKSSVIALIIGLIVGLFVTAQFKSPRQRILNPVEPISSLTETHAALVEKSNRLKDEIKNKRDESKQLQDQLKRSRKNTQDLVEELEKLKDLVGLTEVQDKGIVITLADASRGELSVDSIIHAADLRDVVNILWSKDAKAISINDERVVATTSIDSIINTVLVNNTRITSPFVIKSLGDQRVLAEAVESTQNLADLHRRRKNSGIIFNVERAKEVTIIGFSGSFEVKFAKLKP